jgi:hypothetical protein
MDETHRLQFQFSLFGLLLIVIAVGAMTLPHLAHRPNPASGRVVLDGSALDHALITFALVGSDFVAIGSTDSAGCFTAKTIPGRYKVAIEKRVDILPLRDARSGELINTSGPYHAVIKTRRATPDLFADLETSGLTAEVTPDGPNVFVFNLTTP